MTGRTWRTLLLLFLWVSPYPILFEFVGDLKGLSGADHGLHGGEDVLVNKPDEAPLIFVWVPGSMNDPHLLDEGALAAFSRTWTGRERQSLEAEFRGRVWRQGAAELHCVRKEAQKSNIRFGLLSRSEYKLCLTQRPRNRRQEVYCCKKTFQIHRLHVQDYLLYTDYRSLQSRTQNKILAAHQNNLRVQLAW